MGYALPITVQMTDMSCGECGIAFAVPESWRAEKQRSGNGWYCPNGHSRVYKESDAEKYKKLYEAETERKRAALERANKAESERAQAEAALQRHKIRSKNGVCPCCKRTFKQLAAHMKTKHPDYAK